MSARLDQDHTLHRELERAAAEDPAAPFVTFAGQDATLTRGELHEDALRLAAGLQRLGVEKGDRVAWMLTNRREFLVTLFATARLGAIGLPLNTAYRGDVLDYMVSQTEPKAVVTESECLENLATARDALSAAVVVLADDDRDERRLGARTLPYDDLPGNAEPEPVEVAPWDPALIMYTSGTTGRSKGVVWPHQTPLRIAEVASAMMSLDREDVAHTTLPLFHGNALALFTLGALVARSRLHVGRRFSASAFWQEVVDAEATVTSLLGSMAQILWRQPPSPLERRHRLRLALVIPSPPGEQFAAFEERYRLSVTEAYGLTDVGMLLWTPPAERAPGWCGKPAEGWECAIVDEHDRPLPAGEVGELVARPSEPWLAPLGYWRLPEATAEARRNLWLHTGDLMARREDGWFRFVDRAKDAMRRRGENVSSFEVEQALLSSPAVADCAAYGVPSDLMEDEIMVALAFEEGQAVPLEELIAHCEQRLPYFAVPRYVRVLDALPRTETEKVLKARLREEGVTPDTWDRGSPKRPGGTGRRR